MNYPAGTIANVASKRGGMSYDAIKTYKGVWQVSSGLYEEDDVEVTPLVTLTVADAKEAVECLEWRGGNLNSHLARALKHKIALIEGIPEPEGDYSVVLDDEGHRWLKDPQVLAWRDLLNGTIAGWPGFRAVEVLHEGGAQ